MNYKDKAIELLGEEAEPELAECSPYGSEAYLKSADGYNRMHSKAVKIVEGLLERIEELKKELRKAIDIGLEQGKELQSLKSKLTVENLSKIIIAAFDTNRMITKGAYSIEDRNIEIGVIARQVLAQALIKDLKGEK